MSTPYIVTISSEKGGVGKTTLATNLAIYLKALHEDLPVTLLSFDNHAGYVASVLTNDFRLMPEAKFIRPEDVNDLNWGVDDE